MSCLKKQHTLRNGQEWYSLNLSEIPKMLNHLGGFVRTKIISLHIFKNLKA